MKRIGLLLVIGAVGASAGLASTASASRTTAPPGKELVEVNCEGLGAITVSVPPSEHGKGVGQVVGQNLHGIPVFTEFAAYDVTTKTLVFSGTETSGGGHAHRNQSTTSCVSVPEEVEAALIFGEELPEGVSPADTIRLQFKVNVIVKP
jgi:hypothetical protein